MYPSVIEREPALPTPPTLPARRSSPPAWLIALGLAVVALLPRCLGLADFYTIDEAYHWPMRVRLFAEALRQGDWAATDLTGHPGVTTMWLGALGRWLGRLAGVRDLGGSGAGAAYLATLRLPLAATNALLVVAGYLALRRLLRPGVALLAGLLWATSPFLVAHARLLHLDALLTSFMTLSVLLLLVATNDQRPTTNDETADQQTRRQGSKEQNSLPISFSLIGSGVFAGLALLTKAPSLFLLPFAGLLLFVLVPVDRPTTNDQRPKTDDEETTVRHSSLVTRHGTEFSILNSQFSILQRLRVVLPLYLIWLGTAALVVVLLWPAMWVTPLTALGDVYNEIVANGGAPEPAGNFFLGEPVAAPGWLYYALVLGLRAAPLTLLGLLLLPLVLWPRADERPTTNDQRPTSSESYREGRRMAIEERSRRTRNFRSSIFDLRSSIFGGRWSGEQRVLLALLAFVLLFGLMMSIEPKKFDRYLLPIWPSLEILAAAGLTSILDFRFQILDLRRAQSKIKNQKSKKLLSLVAIVLALNLAWYHPHYLAYYNPLLGGGAMAERVMLVGWGEGMQQVGAWLRARPDLKRGPVLSWIPPTLAPFVPAAPGVLDLRVPLLEQPSSYAVLYVRSVQRKESAVAEAYVRQTPPLYTLRMHGITYATIHQLPRPFDTPLDAQFGTGLHLRGFTQRRDGDTLTITPSWDVRADQPGGRFAFVHLLAPDGRRVTQIDALLDQGMFPSWQAGQQFDTPFPLQLPADLPSGQYRVVMGVYGSDGARLPLRSGPVAPAELDGPDALLVTTLSLP
jgi:4-amino-4-deoxy-L-arabinose transferase-like glycosyltransferase